ncbi:MAG: hypothetical protein L0G04_06815 [Pseudomonas sp.]|nr:hypothetical protein [Pseudomonas sp.]
MLHFITRIVICSFGFRKSTAVPPELLSGRLFLFVSAQTYITPAILAILALITFQLLYSHVANGTPHVASAPLRALFEHLFSTVSSVGHMIDFMLPTMKTQNSYCLAIVIYRQVAVLLLRLGDCVNDLCNKRAQIPAWLKNK